MDGEAARRDYCAWVSSSRAIRIRRVKADRFGASFIDLARPILEQITL